MATKKAIKRENAVIDDLGAEHQYLTLRFLTLRCRWMAQDPWEANISQETKSGTGSAVDTFRAIRMLKRDVQLEGG